MKVLIVLAHPRENSLVYSLKDKFEQGLIEGGHQVTTLDLFKIGFDPVLRQDDEPQWDQGEQVFSEEVHREMERINQHDAVVFCFPLYWSVMPAIMKGYLDRVFNFGYAYAHDRSTTMKLNKIFFMTTAGVSEEGFKKRNHIEFLNHYFNNVIAGYCHIKNSKLRIFDDVRNKKRDTEVHLPQAYQDGLDFDKCENNKNDEVAKYLNGRYISPVEAAWRLFEFAMHEESSSVSPLAAYLENEQPNGQVLLKKPLFLPLVTL
ncbi:hypothetical protein PS6_000359 [Mucor atramentarius]